MTIPDIAALLGHGQNLIIVGLIAIGYAIKHLPENWVPNRYIPSLVLIASHILTPFFIQPYTVAFFMAFIYSGLASLGYEAVIRHVENWIKKKLGVDPEPPTNPPHSV